MEERPLKSMLDSVDLDEIYKNYNTIIANLTAENVQVKAQNATLRRFLTEEYNKNHKGKEEKNGRNKENESANA